jgi:hypothetical protein
MITFISINGVLRDFLGKFLVEYQKNYLETEADAEETFDYQIHEVESVDLMEKCAFQSEDELRYFLYVDFPMEIFGHAAPAYKNVMLDLLRFEQQSGDDIVVVSREFAKSIPSTLFFLSKTTCMARRYRFYESDTDVDALWGQCDRWITDDPYILACKPEGKISVKVKKDYNEHLAADEEITALSDLIQSNEEKQSAQPATPSN